MVLWPECKKQPSLSLLAFYHPSERDRWAQTYFLLERFPAPFLGGPFPLRRNTSSFAARRCSWGILNPGVAWGGDKGGFVVLLVTKQKQCIHQSSLLMLLLQTTTTTTYEKRTHQSCSFVNEFQVIPCYKVSGVWLAKLTSSSSNVQNWQLSEDVSLEFLNLR
jgi:hypothetical protein